MRKTLLASALLAVFACGACREGNPPGEAKYRRGLDEAKYRRGLDEAKYRRGLGEAKYREGQRVQDEAKEAMLRKMDSLPAARRRKLRETMGETLGPQDSAGSKAPSSATPTPPPP